MARSPVSANIKIALVFFAMCIVVAVLFYTQDIVHRLLDRERRSADIYTKAIEYIANEESANGDYTFAFEIVNGIDFPILLTDDQHRPLPTSHKNIPIDSTLSPAEVDTLLAGVRDRMRGENPPLVVKHRDSLILNYVYYGESDLVKQLRVLPYIEILVTAMFILVGYIGFSYIKRSEQANIWVGLSKETAHQLGTPLSSLMGWLELLREQEHDPEAVRRTVEEMESDVQRLNRVALRFSKIGSKPDLVGQDLMFTIHKIAGYIRKRTPQLGKKVEIIVPDLPSVRARYNAELLEWVFENLLKNALDAIDGPDGRIEFAITSGPRHVIVDVIDNGKGIDARRRKDIFRPGYSTKKRGWGLGLSLSRRIVEDYHAGRLTVHDSAPGRGTTFRIKLPAA
jgi:signal transduction histidine kinase